MVSVSELEGELKMVIHSVRLDVQGDAPIEIILDRVAVAKMFARMIQLVYDMYLSRGLYESREALTAAYHLLSSVDNMLSSAEKLVEAGFREYKSYILGLLDVANQIVNTTLELADKALKPGSKTYERIARQWKTAYKPAI